MKLLKNGYFNILLKYIERYDIFYLFMFIY